MVELCPGSSFESIRKRLQWDGGHEGSVCPFPSLPEGKFQALIGANPPCQIPVYTPNIS